MNLLKIKNICQEDGIGLKDLAVKIGMSEQNLHRCIKNNKITANDLEKIAGVLSVPINTFFENQTGNSNYADNIENSTLIQANESKVEYDSKNNDLRMRINDIEKINIFYKELTESLMNDITNVYVEIIEKFPDMQKFLANMGETKHFISRLNTILKLSENKTLYNKMFFDYFKNPY